MAKIKVIFIRKEEEVKTLLDSIKNAAKNNGANIFDSPQATELYTIFNKMFYLKKDKEKESQFIKQVITRGQEGSERVGLHASSLIVDHKDFCLREQILSLVYKASQGEDLPVNLIRIFEEGNSVHEKWQRMFLRAGYSKVTDLDFTQFKKEWMLSFTPDAIIEVEGFGKLVVEIKSVNPFLFDRMDKHPTASKQLQWYMFLTGIHQGIVLSENKGNQEFKIEFYKFDKEVVKPFIERTEKIITAYKNFIKNKKMVKKLDDCQTENSERCLKCRMRDSCWNIGMGRVKL